MRTLVVAAVLLAGCGAPPRRPIPMDIHSRAEPNRVRVTHVSLDLTLDFEKKEVRGTATLALERPDVDAPLVLDAQGLAIESTSGADGSAREWELGTPDANLGSALTVRLRPGDRSVRIAYRTTEKSDALPWLAPSQTAGGRFPLVFTQGQSILTRTWIPLQDTPAVRVTYDATIRAPAPLTVVMSAEQLGRDATGAFRFRLTQPIPSYLIALACGDLRFEAISPRCGIWAEPPVVAGARAELADTEAMIAAAEKLFGPYRWGRYDLLILPPSFPFGGMENPRLTFATPTILAGDKSLVSLVAHELAHSWSGNLVTNASWSDFWLNEGFTVYCEQRIMEVVFGEDRSRMEMQLARDDLEREMKDLPEKDQVLRIDLHGRHPDDGFTGVQYEKGALLLRRIEQAVGRPAFDTFLRGYFDEHAFMSLSTDEFVAYLREKLPPAREIDLDAWLTKPGIPADAPAYRSQAFERADRAIEAWRTGTTPDTAGWTTQQWIRFLEGIAPELDAASMAKLDATFGLTKSGNSEILCVWLRLAIEKGYAAADVRLEEFLMNVGRRKFLKPLYTELAKTEAGKARARAIFARARPRYHAVSAQTVEKLLE